MIVDHKAPIQVVGVLPGGLRCLMPVSLRAGWLDASVVEEVVFVVLALFLPVEVKGGSPEIF